MFLFGLVPIIDGYIYWDVGINSKVSDSSDKWKQVKDISMYAAISEATLGLFGFLSRKDADGLLSWLGWLGRFGGWVEEGYMVHLISEAEKDAPTTGDLYRNL